MGSAGQSSKNDSPPPISMHTYDKKFDGPMAVIYRGVISRETPYTIDNFYTLQNHMNDVIDLVARVNQTFGEYTPRLIFMERMTKKLLGEITKRHLETKELRRQLKKARRAAHTAAVSHQGGAARTIGHTRTRGAKSEADLSAMLSNL